MKSSINRDAARRRLKTEANCMRKNCARGARRLTNFLQIEWGGAVSKRAEMKSQTHQDESNDLLINGRHFVQRGDQWVDTKVERMPEARRVRVRFDSREYFELVIRHPRDVPMISGARNVQVALADTVYEIYD
jgi:hypothetical protein